MQTLGATAPDVGRDHEYEGHATLSITLDEVKQRILKGIDEMNAKSARFQWKSFDFQMTET